jgi:predicted ATPase
MSTQPRWTSTSIIPPAAAALADLAARAAEPGEDADAIAFDLYERIGREQDATRALEAARDEVRAYEALVRALMAFTHGRPGDDTARRVDATIARFNLGSMFRSGGSGDRYLIPHELAPDE